MSDQLRKHLAKAMYHSMLGFLYWPKYYRKHRKTICRNARGRRQRNLKINSELVLARERASKRKRYTLHKEQVTAQIEKWRKSNPDKVRRIKSRWKKRHPENGCANRNLRRARQYNATTGDTDAINRVYARAKELRRWFDVVVDHIIPIAKGGSHSTENLQIILRKENESKNAKLDYKPTVIFT